MKTVNRQAAVVFLQQPFVDWLNSIEERSGETTRFTIAEANDEPHIYLLEHHDDWDANLAYVDQFKPEIFESELNAWYADPDLWPEDRSIGVINKWLRIELSSMVIDLERGRLKKREW